MTYRVSYRVNFDVRHMVFTHTELLGMGGVCQECVDPERFVIGTALSRMYGICVVDGEGGFELVANISPLFLCHQH